MVKTLLKAQNKGGPFDIEEAKVTVRAAAHNAAVRGAPTFNQWLLEGKKEDPKDARDAYDLAKEYKDEKIEPAKWQGILDALD